ncbi:MAG: hypothetical protein HQL58_09620 [Magnetococcales bacterium]|nr:hypothetical protein [Magnetococcales bacterium]
MSSITTVGDPQKMATASWLEHHVNSSMISNDPAYLQWLDVQIKGSQLIPGYFKNVMDIGMLISMSKALGDPLWTILDHLYLIKGKKMWSAQYVMAKILSCKRLRGFVTRCYPDPKTGEETCIAEATLQSTGEKISCTLTLSQARALASGGRSETWQNDPIRMLTYRTATKFGNMFIPDLLLGIEGGDELPEELYHVDPFEGL